MNDFKWQTIIAFFIICYLYLDFILMLFDVEDEIWNNFQNISKKKIAGNAII